MNKAAKPMEPDQESQDFNGSDAVIACLKHQGVDVVFGMVGGAIMPVYDALYRDGSIRHLIAGHEQGESGRSRAAAPDRPAISFSSFKAYEIEVVQEEDENGTKKTVRIKSDPGAQVGLIQEVLRPWVVLIETVGSVVRSFLGAPVVQNTAKVARADR